MSFIDKRLEGKGLNQETEKLKTLVAEKDKDVLEFDFLNDVLDTLRSVYIEETKNKPMTFSDWLNSKPDEYFERLKFNSGGKVVDLASYRKLREPNEVKKIDLSAALNHTKNISSLTPSERDVVNRLLKMSLGKEE
jgi:hypothetical protein